MAIWETLSRQRDAADVKAQTERVCLACLKNSGERGAWVALLVKYPTLDLRVVSLGSALGLEPI